MDTANKAKDDWLNILSKAATSELPEGYKTTAMLAKEYNVTIRQVRSALEKALGPNALKKFDNEAQTNMEKMNNYSKILYSKFKSDILKI